MNSKTEGLYLISLTYLIAQVLVIVVLYLSENTTIWDLGANTEVVFFLHHADVKSLIAMIFYKGDVFLFYPFVPSTLDMAIAEAVILTIPIPLIYDIVKIETGKISYIPIFLYIFYPLAWGMTFFSFHFQNLFIPFFLALYLAKEKNMMKTSLLFAFLASVVRFPYTYLVTFFSVVEFFKKRNKTMKAVLILSLIISGVSTIMSLEGFFPNAVNNAHVQTDTGYLAIKPSLSNVLTVLMMYAPVGFLPFFSYYAINLVIPTLLMGVTNYLGYQFPYVLTSQYASLYLPFIIISIIDVMKKMDRRVLLSVMVIEFLMFLAFSVVSPVSLYSSVFYSAIPHIGSSFQAQIIVKLIPQNATVLAQNNIVQLYPRYEYFPLSISITKLEDPNWTAGNFTVENTGARVHIQYVVIDTGNPWFYLSYNCANEFLEHGYGIYAVYGTYYILQYNYTKNPIIYEPQPYVLGTSIVKVNLGPGIYHTNSTVFFNNTETNVIKINEFGTYEIVTTEPTILY